MTTHYRASFWWVRADQERPTKSGDYLTLSEAGIVTTLHYSKKHDAFNVRDDDDNDVDLSTEIAVCYWAKVPVPPVHHSQHTYASEHYWEVHGHEYLD